uniref:E9 protein n=1 Tax=Globodera rostochiensis TaxID=31243 RepID=Q5K4Q5_GLORO|nr:E9 protein [Globodera rostochiensis]
MHLCVYSIFTFLFLPLSLISVPNANAELTDPLNPWSPFEERAFLEFVKGLEKWKLNNEAKENLSHLLGGIKEKHTKLTKLKGTDFDKAMKEDLALRFESILGTLYLLVENWRCDDHEQTKRQKYRKYLYFAHEYIFRVFIKTANPKLSEQMPAVAPRFQHGHGLYSIIDIIAFLNRKSKFEPKLLNEKALEKVDEIIQMHQLKRTSQKIVQILAEINEELESDKYFAKFNDERFKIVPMLLQKCWNITKQTQIGINYSKEFQEKVSEDIRQQFVGNSEIQIREQFHEFLKRMFETTVINCE